MEVTATMGAEDSPSTASVPATEPVDALAFDDALAELQRTVVRLEAGGGQLEEAIALYERGVALHERCVRLLADAELRVRRLVERAGGALEAIEAPKDEDPLEAHQPGDASAVD